MIRCSVPLPAVRRTATRGVAAGAAHSGYIGWMGRDLREFEGGVSCVLRMQSVFGRHLDVIDDQYRNGTFLRFQFEPELFLDRGEDGG